ncbi:MAG TPA: GvpL/GvpF family gas vesicle protein [Gemmatimonadaceae bacterium]|nr:GvpL/GvpF family gas vesicle protein [Gemmatimonadaceae bacterium]
MAQNSVEGLRLYGVATVDGQAVTSLATGTTLVPFRMLGAVVAPGKYSRVTLDDKEMNEYTRILEEVQSNTAVLPAPPGTVFRTRENLARWLELHYFTLTQAIGMVEGHGEARVKITRAPSAEAVKSSSGELKEQTKELAAVASDSLRVLRGQAAATISLPVPEDDTTLIAHASFLVDIEHWGIFTELVGKEDQRHTDLDFQVTGPWPPYDFVRMEFGS